MSADRLFDALRRSPHCSGSNVGLADVDCYRCHATAGTVVKGQADAVGVLFRHETADGSWRVLGIGSSMDCAGVPADVAQLQHCFPG